MSYRTNLSKPSGVALTGYTFTGKANLIARRNVARYFDVPEIEQKMLVRRAAVAEGAAKNGAPSPRLTAVLS
ncbi:hypothetical protein ASF98_22765 [Arthrobacter sp. Leaf337]|nr:hypothetical protein ASF98_22765 [Arthrobacter sp. Leaf337]